MFRYYIDLALRSLRRGKALTALMVLAIALGIGACMTTLTVYHVLSDDPLPEGGRSSRLYHVQLDAEPGVPAAPGAEPREVLTRLDAEALLRQRGADRQAMMADGVVAVQPAQGHGRPREVSAYYSSADFFPMFGVPFLFGSGWSADDDAGSARVAVISRRLNDQLFAGADSTGRMLRVGEHDLRIAGVLAHWQPVPHFYALDNHLADSEDVFLPLATAIELRLPLAGSLRCWGSTAGSGVTALHAPCAWVHYWVELATPAKAQMYREGLQHYSDQQRAAGRFQRTDNVRLRPLNGWLEHKGVVSGDVQLQLWLAFGFLAVCLVNTVGLLLVKCLRRSGEIGVRRALGATQAHIFAQFLVEAGAIGLAGGVLGLGVALLGLWSVRMNTERYATLARLDGEMLLATFVLALVASLLAGLLPAWRACRVAPALQLKSS
jgi:putative ABC transport system permease protein